MRGDALLPSSRGKKLTHVMRHSRFKVELQCAPAKERALFWRTTARGLNTQDTKDSSGELQTFVHKFTVSVITAASACGKCSTTQG